MSESPFKHMINNIVKDFNLNFDKITGGTEKKVFYKLPHIEISVTPVE